MLEFLKMQSCSSIRRMIGSSGKTSTSSISTIAIAGDRLWCGSELGGASSDCPAMLFTILPLSRGATASQARAVCSTYRIHFLVANIYDPSGTTSTAGSGPSLLQSPILNSALWTAVDGRNAMITHGVNHLRLLRLFGTPLLDSWARHDMAITPDAQIEPRPTGVPDGRKLITIITPCYNEVLNVREVHRRVMALAAHLSEYRFELSLSIMLRRMAPWMCSVGWQQQIQVSR